MVPLRFRPDIAAQLDTLDQAIRAYAETVYRAGMADGSSLLHKLAAGQFTEQEFNEAVMGIEKRR